ncbi:MAG: MFS transporter [Clostridiales bacterium]|nr:MFS transporter [Clostridiales bacterium]
MEKNIKLFYLFSMFDELLILGPIIVIYLFFKGLTFSQIMLLQSISALAIVVFEVPTGAVADKIGRKFSIASSKFVWIVSLLFYIFGNSFMLFAVAEILFSIGITLKSGADTALLYDTLKSLDRTEEFTAIQGKARSYIYLTQGFGAIVASLIYSINEYLPMLFSIGFMVVAFMIILLFKEPIIEDKKGRYGDKYFKHIMDSAKYVAHHPKIRSVMFFAMIFFAYMRAGFWLYQPYMESVNIEVKYFGVFFFIFNMIAAYASRNASRIMKYTKNHTLMMMLGLLAVSFLAMGASHIWLGALLILPQQMARGMYTPIINKYTNKHIPSNKRATVLSFISLAASLSAAVMLPLVGLMNDYKDVFASHYILAGSLCVFSLGIYFYMKVYMKDIKSNLQ